MTVYRNYYTSSTTVIPRENKIEENRTDKVSAGKVAEKEKQREEDKTEYRRGTGGKKRGGRENEAKRGRQDRVGEGWEERKEKEGKTIRWQRR
ncbi:hypothetical protein Pmani_022134 [Petrolisthes manimaculis]|uniref:Uncharacterized protein n=1 Tax=Petrolisthes manimaculis TaxID=1843537 RepID=A0AAE1PES0_9EUCA|nr:hypothetical protein Pmani_022134 [Petrolisthes manimaculis]